jgi:hypothetical protein
MPRETAAKPVARRCTVVVARSHRRDQESCGARRGIQGDEPSQPPFGRPRAGRASRSPLTRRPRASVPGAPPGETSEPPLDPADVSGAPLDPAEQFDAADTERRFDALDPSGSQPGVAQGQVSPSQPQHAEIGPLLYEPPGRRTSARRRVGEREPCGHERMFRSSRRRRGSESEGQDGHQLTRRSGLQWSCTCAGPLRRFPVRVCAYARGACPCRSQATPRLSMSDDQRGNQ